MVEPLLAQVFQISLKVILILFASSWLKQLVDDDHLTIFVNVQARSSP